MDRLYRGDGPPTPHEFIWVELALPVLSMRVMIGIDAHRHPPLVPVVNVNLINYICVGNHLWCPTVGEIGGMMQQGTAMGHQLSAQRCTAAAAGQPMPTPLPVAPAGAVVPVGVVAGQAGVGVGGPAWPQGLDAAPGPDDGGPVLLVQAPVGAPGNLGFVPPPAEAQALAQQMLSLQGAMDDLRVEAKKEKRKKSATKKKKDSDKKDKKKGGKRYGSSSKKKRSRGRSRGSSSSSSGRSSRGRSRSSSGPSDSTRVNKKNIQWTGPNGRNKKVSQSQLARAVGLRFKRRSGVVNYASKYPGALGALFLSQVRMKLMGGQVEDLKDLYKTDPTVWAGTLTGLKEIRDLREVQLLSKVVSELNKDRIPQAVDFMTHRIREVLAAKKAGGSWEKGALVSLLASDQAYMGTSMPDGALDF